ncbi:uncharacterized protein AC631_03161 [Debaryomyces fabryi]|uniref:Uncharacterized protein n=1 Tax=Debaryomyces fabryi TaxID=58627 RepID=A0A0V1PYE5_9ASCO|nr:uncharacterized protein AC631_03161 [Debaryomyces fabryi]KSA01093.1 hypothetical protein AC631_03161 [Debaryomyces fabryi]CUM48963.1 unnamed protein product [Debaryomyces fabryi]
MSYHQYIPNKEPASQLSIETIPFNAQTNPINGAGINNHSLQFSPTNEQFRPMPPQQVIRPQIVDSSPTSTSHDMFQSPTQLTSQMNRFHLQTPTTDSSPVFSNNNKNGSTNVHVFQTVTPTNSIPRSNYQNQYVFTQNQHATPIMVGQATMNMSPNANSYQHNQLANQHLVQQQFLMQQQHLMAQNNQFIPANPMNQNIEHKVTKQVDNDKKVSHSRKSSVASSVTKPSKPKKSSRSKKDSFSSLEDLKASDVYEYDKEITIDDLLKDDPLLELTSPVALEDESNDNSLFSSFIDYDDMSQPQPNFVGLGLDLDFNLNEIMNEPSTNGSTVKSNSNLSLYKRPSTPEQDKLIEQFGSPKKKSSSPKSSRTPSSSPTKYSLDKVIQKSDTLIGAVPRSSSNSSINTTPVNRSQPSFSLSECSNTFPVNSNTTNNFSFVIEKKSFSIQSNSNSKLRRKSLPKISQKVNERPSVKKANSVTDASIVKPSNHTPIAHHHSSSSLATSPKVLRNMKSGMLLFQLDLNNNGNK